MFAVRREDVGSLILSAFVTIFTLNLMFGLMITTIVSLPSVSLVLGQITAGFSVVVMLMFGWSLWSFFQAFDQAMNDEEWAPQDDPPPIIPPDPPDSFSFFNDEEVEEEDEDDESVVDDDSTW